MSSSNPFLKLEEHQISASQMAEFLSYDEETGELTWNKRNAYHYSDPIHHKRWNNFYAGARAGTLLEQGYLGITIFGKQRKAHRIAWLLTHGEWPTEQIDHINGDRSDNRISNIREANSLENMRNRKLNKDSKSGFQGVYFQKAEGKWRAHIKNNKKNIHLGYFKNFEDAVRARIAAEKEIGFHENHGRVVQLQRRVK